VCGASDYQGWKYPYVHEEEEDGDPGINW
jgi:hypothetical protein